MAFTASDSLPCYPAAPGSALPVDDHDHQLYLDPSAAASFPAADAHEEAEHHQPPPSATEPRKPRKRARASRRAPTTVLTTDASNFRAMVQEFTGFPAQPFAPHFGPGVLFGAGPSPSSSGGASFHHQLLRPPPLKLSASPHGPAPSCTTSNTTSFAHTLFANPPTAAVAPSLSSESYSRFAPTFAAGAVPSYGEGFASALEGEGAEHGHGLATSFLHADDRYHDH